MALTVTPTDEMKTLKVGEKIYEIVDDEARTDLNEVKADLSDITEVKYGKNRFNKDACLDGYVLNPDGSLRAASSWSVSNYCYVEGFASIYGSQEVNGSRYSLSLAYLCTYDSNKTFIEQIGDLPTNPVTLDPDVCYVRFAVGTSNLNTKVQLEEGTSITAYQPYSETLSVKTDTTLTSETLPANAKAVGGKIGKVIDVLSYEPVTVTLNNAKYLNPTTGAITDAGTGAENNRVSDYIEIPADSKIMLTTEHFWGQGLYVFYDEDYNYISGRGANSGGTVTQLQCKIIDTPINAKYMAIGYLYQTSMPEPFLFTGIKQNAKPSEIWSDKKWACVGDSLTAYNERTSMHYFDFVAGATGIQVYNMGVSGSGYAQGADNFMTRVLNVPTDSDVVTIFGSGNDASVLPLGTASDTGTSTLGGVINTTIDNLYSIMPVVQLGIVTPTPWQGNMPSDNGWMENYSNMIVEICKRRSIPCLDLFHCSNLNPNSEAVRQLAYANDDGGGVHPSEKGHKLIAPRFKAFLESLLM